MLHNEEKTEAPFLPQKPRTKEELKAAVLKNLDSTLDLIEPLPIQNTTEITMDSLRKIPNGVYRLDNPPNLEFWEAAVAPGNGEIGLIKINGKWIISTNQGHSVQYPDIIRVIHGLRLFDLDIHTHPFTDFVSQFPSLEKDLLYIDSTVNGKNYIFTPLGLTVFQVPEHLPEKYPTLDSIKYWLNAWRNEQLKKVKKERPGLDIREYDEIHNRELFEQFFRINLNLDIIPWTDREKIEKIYSELISTSSQ